MHGAEHLAGQGAPTARRRSASYAGVGAAGRPAVCTTAVSAGGPPSSAATAARSATSHATTRTAPSSASSRAARRRRGAPDPAGWPAPPRAAPLASSQRATCATQRAGAAGDQHRARRPPARPGGRRRRGTSRRPKTPVRRTATWSSRCRRRGPRRAGRGRRGRRGRAGRPGRPSGRAVPGRRPGRGPRPAAAQTSPARVSGRRPATAPRVSAHSRPAAGVGEGLGEGEQWRPRRRAPPGVCARSAGPAEGSTQSTPARPSPPIRRSRSRQFGAGEGRRHGRACPRRAPAWVSGLRHARVGAAVDGRRPATARTAGSPGPAATGSHADPVRPAVEDGVPRPALRQRARTGRAGASASRASASSPSSAARAARSPRSTAAQNSASPPSGAACCRGRRPPASSAGAGRRTWAGRPRRAPVSANHCVPVDRHAVHVQLARACSSACASGRSRRSTATRQHGVVVRAARRAAIAVSTRRGPTSRNVSTPGAAQGGDPVGEPHRLPHVPHPVVRRP